MNKTAIKNFAIWARNKLIADITYKAGLMGISENGIKAALPQSTPDMEFYDFGAKEPYPISGNAVGQRGRLVNLIHQKAAVSDYKTAYRNVVEEVAYTWFNRLIAIRFMEVNDYLPSHLRVLSSESNAKLEPDLVTAPFDAAIDLTDAEKTEIIRLKSENKLDECFRMLFIRQCNALNVILPKLFEKTADYSELLLNLSVTDQDGVVYHLVRDIAEDDFNIAKGGQVEIIGWLYQYYNTEPKDETFALLKKNVKITKERIPAVTQLFTPDWIVRYMVENSLGRLWLEGHPNGDLRTGWKYYLDEAEQEADVQAELAKIREEYQAIKPEEIKVIDPCMGSGHILVYAFDVLMQIYETVGYSQRDAAKSILAHNLYGLDIDDRAFQLAYFAVMMKARQYNRRILNGKADCHIYSIQESNLISGAYPYEMDEFLLSKEHQATLNYLLEAFKNAKAYGSIIELEDRDYVGLLKAWQYTASQIAENVNLTLWYSAVEQAIPPLIEQAIMLSQKYDVVVTNPPYMGISNSNEELNMYVKKKFPESKADLFAVFIEKCGKMIGENRYQAMITQHSWMFLSSFEKLRAKLQSSDMMNMAHLGARAFEEIGGEVVQTTSFVMRKSNIQKYKGTYCRLVEPNTQQGKEAMFLCGENRYVAVQDDFSQIPGLPIAYWASSNIYKLFKLPSIIETTCFKEGITTGDNDKYLRMWYEISKKKFQTENNHLVESETFWIPCNKGGEYRRWYGNRLYVIDWGRNGEKLKEFKGSSFRNAAFQRREGGTFSNLTSRNFSARFTEAGFAFESKGTMFFSDHLYEELGWMNTKIFSLLLSFVCPTLDFKLGTVQKLPKLSGGLETIMLVKYNIDISKTDWDNFEISWDFKKHPLLCCTTIPTAFAQWEAECTTRFTQLKSNEEELNRIFIELYGLQDELPPEVEDKDVTVRKADLGRDIRSLISYAIGCMFGRYSLDASGIAFAGGEWDESRYRTFVPDTDNILPITDEEYFKDDIIGLLCAWLKKVYGADTLEENLDFIAKALGNKGNTSREVIRGYLIKDFFSDHCKIYQKRPIYWLFDSGKQNGFKALVYLHRYDENTIGNLRIDYLHRMERIYESEITRMQDIIDNSANTHEVTGAVKRKEKLQKQVKECREYDEKIAHLALARIAIDLDDGVKVNYEKIQTGTDEKKYSVLAKI